MEALACLTGLFFWKRLIPGYWKAFTVYLFIITCCEFTGWYMVSNEIKGSKFMYQYFVIPLEFLFMHFLYSRNLSVYFKKTVIILSVIYLTSLITELLFLKNIKWLWLSVSYSTGCLSLFVLGTVYFLELHNSEKVIQYKKTPFFWVNTGLIVFYVGTFPFYSMPKNLYLINESLYYTLSWLGIILNYIMYSFFINGFLCFRIREK
jgi:hypothetical protein